MCGIAGFIEFQKNSISSFEPESLMRSMLDQIKHRGPDGFGISLYGYDKEGQFSKDRINYYHFPAQVVLGHRRLSIIDLSDEAFQPMRDNDDSIEVVYNGEIYNYVELREELKKNYHFTTSSDTEVLIAAYKIWGPEMLSKLDGMFAIAIWDKEKQQLFCARDSMNIKPFYYNISEKGFIFGSEPKVILTGLNTNGTVDNAHAAEFLIAGLSDTDEGTFYNEVKQLRGGHYFLVSKDQRIVKPIPFWKVPEIEPLTITQSEWSIRYYKTISEAVKRQLRSDVPVGTSLSGGIDSGVIVTIAGELLKDKAKNYNTLTFSFPNFANDESEMAKSIANKSGMNWHQVIPSPETLANELEKMIIQMGEPFSSLSMFAQYKVMQKASELGLKVMLDGQGGDELYLGYSRVAQNAMFYHLKKLHLKKFWQEWSGLAKNASIPKLKSLAYQIFFNTPTLAINRNIRRVSAFTTMKFLKNGRKELLNDLYAPKNVYDKQLDELNKYCLPRLLRYADRNSMAFSVESRVPHLSNLTRDFALSLPIANRVNNGWTKYTVRKAMQGKIPDEVLWCNIKKGFDIPQGYWIELLESQLIQWVEKVNDNELFNKKEIIKSIKDKNKRDDFALWRVLSVIAWMYHSKVSLLTDE
jgi:asparagine synthase (glutamine-hydrolysing)